MEVGREHELYLGYPLLHRLRFGLVPFVVLLEVVWEVAVQVEATSVVSEGEVTVRIEGQMLLSMSRKWSNSHDFLFDLKISNNQSKHS